MSRAARRSRLAAAAVVLAAVAGLAALSAVVALPGERELKSAVGLDYDDPGCAPVHDRGRFGSWRRERPLPEPLEEARAVAVGGRAVIVGGVVGAFVDEAARSTARVSGYDLQTGELGRLPSLPRRLNHTGIAEHDGAVYVAGGDFDRPLEQAPNDRVWRLEPGAGRWEEVTRLPTPRGALGLAVVGDTLYAVGGRVLGEAVGTVEAFDLATRRWSERAPLRPPRDHLGAAAAGGALYVAGGRFPGGEELAAFERYDAAEDRWQPLADMPAGTSGAELVGVRGRLLIAGGEDSDQGWVTGRTMAYDLATGEWDELPPSPRPKHGYAAAVGGGRLYTIGGSRCAGSTPTASVESLPVAP